MQGVEERIGRRPLVHVRQRDRGWTEGADVVAPGAGDLAARLAHDDAVRRLDAGAAAARGHRHADSLIVEVRLDLERAHVLRRHRFQPHRLPDAGHGRVPDAARPPYLLPSRLLAVVGRIAHRDDQLLIAARSQLIGDVEGERIVSAPVLSHSRPVDIDDGFPVHRAEIQQQMAARSAVRGGEGPPVPQPLLRRDPHTGSAQLRLDGERDQDAAGE